MRIREMGPYAVFMYFVLNTGVHVWWDCVDCMDSSGKDRTAPDLGIVVVVVVVMEECLVSSSRIS